MRKNPERDGDFPSIIVPSMEEGTEKKSYGATSFACYLAYIVQAVVNNFLPLLFVYFHSEFGIPDGQITLLITINFSVQLLIDLFSPHFVDRIGYRLSMILANACVILGFVLLCVLPSAFGNPFAGLSISVLIYAVGGGLMEVLVSPIVEALPSAHKEAKMSLLHSFYCFGQAFVVLVSSLFFRLGGIANWRIPALVWCVLPLADLVLFLFVPIRPLVKDGEKGKSLAELLRMPLFYILFVLMFCAGASEQAVSQWASTFAEKGLGVSKEYGDLFGPTAFALFMGASRLLYGFFGKKIDLRKAMAGSALLCVGAYLLTGLSKEPVWALTGCALIGFGVGIFWPGTFSLASERIVNGGTEMFALFALAGDLGCTLGPASAGFLLSAASLDLQQSLLCCTFFPLVLLVFLGLEHLSYRKEKANFKENQGS